MVSAIEFILHDGFVIELPASMKVGNSSRFFCIACNEAMATEIAAGRHIVDNHIKPFEGLSAEVKAGRKKKFDDFKKSKW